MVHIVEATRSEQIAVVRSLFLEYAEWLGISLCFQGFDEELETLPGRYAPPRGRLLLAMEGEVPAGCIALRPLDATSCEMKRLYVRASHRGQGLGRDLVLHVLRDAARLGYTRMRLDTLPVMAAAQRLYAALGFREIVPYYPNPVEGAVFMEIDLPAKAATEGPQAVQAE